MRKVIFISAMLLSGCASTHHVFQTPKVSQAPVTQPTPHKLDYQLVHKNGFEQFLYGSAQPVVNCSPFELTVITLEKGESVSSVSSGDPLRWSYSVVYSGNGREKEAQVMVKPAQENISTDMIITTDKRMYTLKLVSTNNGKYMRNIKFCYPDEILKAQEQEKEQALTQINVSQLNFNYSINSQFLSSPRWKPTKVFDDGIHTFIQMPDSVSSEDLPTIFVINENSDEKMLVNYRYKKPYFIVDKIFKKASMLLGVGHNQSTVIITNQNL